MTEINELYKCNVCGNIVEIVNKGFGQLVCCSVPMTKIETQTTEETFGEKHLPVLVKEDEKYIIKVGKVEHPMEEAHHIMFIEAISKDKKYLKRVYLKAGDKPELDPECKCFNLDARELCNIHGLFEAPLTKEEKP